MKSKSGFKVLKNTRWVALITQLLVIGSLIGCSDQDPSTVNPALHADGASKPDLQSAQAEAAGQLAIDGLVWVSADDERWMVDAGADQHSDEALAIELAGQVTGLGLLGQRWYQVAGPDAVIVSPESFTSAVVLPHVDQPTELRFRLAAANDALLAAYDDVQIKVLPLDKPFELSGAEVEESAGQVVLRLTARKPFAEDWSFDVQVESGTTDADDLTAPAQGVTLAAGEVAAEVVFDITDDEFEEGSEFFTVRLLGQSATGTAHVTASVVIRDNDQGGTVQPGKPQVTDGTDQSQTDLGYEEAMVRLHLTWDNPASELRLQVTDPCGNLLTHEQPDLSCQELSGQWLRETGTRTESLYWETAAPQGDYQIGVSHVAGEAADYTLYIFWGDRTQTVRGAIAAGGTLNLLNPSLQPPGAPLIVSTPPAELGAGSQFTYTLEVAAGQAGDAVTFQLVNAPDTFTLDPVTGVLSGTVEPARALPLATANTRCLIPQSAAKVKTGWADILIAIDESGSMSEEHNWIPGMIANLEGALSTQGIGAVEPNLYGLVGFSDYERPRNILFGEAGYGSTGAPTTLMV